MLPFYRGVANAYLVEKLLRAEFSIYCKGWSNQCPSFIKTHSNPFPPPIYPFLKWHTFLWQSAIGPFINWSDMFHICYIFTAGLRVCNLAQGLNILFFTQLAWVMFVRGHKKLYSVLSIWCFQTHSCFVQKSISTLQNISEFIKLIMIYIGIFSWIIINIYNVSEETFQLITRYLSSTDNIQISYKSYKYNFFKNHAARFQTHRFMAKRKIS